MKNSAVTGYLGEKIAGKDEVYVQFSSNADVIEISEIDRSGRVRTNYGDIEALAQTMIEIGLETPIIITNDKILVDGERRIQAFESLGIEKIPFVFFDVDDILKAEFIANGARKDYTTREIGTIIKRIEAAKQIEIPLVRNNEIEATLPGRTVEIVSQITGNSPAQIKKIKRIVEEADNNPDFDRYLSDIDTKKKSVNTVHTLVTIEQRNSVKIEPAEGKTSLLTIDPPWEFGNKTIRGSGIHHYDLMNLDEICAMELPLAEEAVVFLWIPNSMKYDRIKRKVGERDTIVAAGKVNGKMQYRTVKKDVVMTRSTLDHVLLAWNLTPKSEIIWYKVDNEYKSQPGPGSYSKSTHETLVIAFRGKPAVPMVRYDSVVAMSKTEHSVKPDVFYKMMHEMYPGRAGIEMFAREPHEGFAPWGNEVKQ